ncbi:MAG TPA: sigma-E factor negative regulatory protein [Rhodanobacteraceae bacterium]
MDPTSREDLSALMDGELAAEPTRFLLRRLDHDPELSGTWSRWHLIRACLAADPARMSTSRRDDDFSARVSAAVRADARPQVRQRSWTRYVGGSAIAAGVAVAALMFNIPNSQITDSAAANRRGPAASSAAVATALATGGAPGANVATPPWLLTRQPTVLTAQPASANVVYGTGLMQPDYLRRVSYANDTAVSAFEPAYDSGMQPFSIVLVPAPPPASSAVAVQH